MLIHQCVRRNVDPSMCEGQSSHLPTWIKASNNMKCLQSLHGKIWKFAIVVLKGYSVPIATLIIV